MKPTAQGSLITMATAKELIQYSPFNILKGAAQMEAMYVCSDNVLGLILSTKPHEED